MNVRQVPLAWALLAPLACSAPAWAQVPVSGQQGHQHGQTTAAPASWQLMQDGVVLGLFNHQGGPRGGREFVVPNWWMGMATKEKGRHHIGLNAMFSLDPATVGSDGYREIFQVGEALDGRPLIEWIVRNQKGEELLLQLLYGTFTARDFSPRFRGKLGIVGSHQLTRLRKFVLETVELYGRRHNC